MLDKAGFSIHLDAFQTHTVASCNTLLAPPIHQSPPFVAHLPMDIFGPVLHGVSPWTASHAVPIADVT